MKFIYVVKCIGSGEKNNDAIVPIGASEIDQQSRDNAGTEFGNWLYDNCACGFLEKMKQQLEKRYNHQC